jgi:hypothetical protein
MRPSFLHMHRGRRPGRRWWLPDEGESYWQIDLRYYRQQASTPPRVSASQLSPYRFIPTAVAGPGPHMKASVGVELWKAFIQQSQRMSARR